MAVVSILIPSYRELQTETRRTLMEMIHQTQCLCRTHNPWECPNGKHDIVWQPPLGSSIVHWVRNQIVALGMYGNHPKEKPLPEYFLMIDDDMTMQPHFLKRLLSHKKDIVAGICTVRKDPPVPNIRFWLSEKAMYREPVEWDWDSQKLIEIDAVGAAFVLVKRRVFEQMGKAWLECRFEKAEDLRKGYPAELVEEYWNKKSAFRLERFNNADSWQKKDCWWFQLLDNVDDKQIGELGEDLSFCNKAKQLGFRVFADPQVLPGHIGQYAYSVDDYRFHVERLKRENGALEHTGNHPQQGPVFTVAQPEMAEVA